MKRIISILFFIFIVAAITFNFTANYIISNAEITSAGNGYTLTIFNNVYLYD